MPSSADILGNDGLLKKAIADFSPRVSQQQMAAAIERVIATDATLIAEAGTGTGKTFAYLVPVFLSNKKTIISTGTKNLQDQLFFKDIPIIQKILSFTGKISLLKGRANYLCRYRLKQSLEDGRFSSRQLVSELQSIHQWSYQTITGDIADLTTVTEDSSIWPSVTSTVDNCLSQDCEFYNECFVIKARQKALVADIVVVNHHLFFADRVLQEEKFGELLPEAKVIIFDEAHHLPEIASQFLSTSITGRQLNELARDIEREGLATAKESTELLEVTRELQTAVQEMRFALGPELRRFTWPDQPSLVLQNTMNRVKAVLQQLDGTLKSIAVASKGLENGWRRTAEIITRFDLLTGATPDNTIHWCETYLKSFTIQFTPMKVSESFQQYMEQKNRTWIFTSATLTVKNNFGLFIENMGLQYALTLQLKSPFDYRKQALLYVPRGLPDARASQYTEQMIEAIVPVLEITQGRAFILFTSYKALEIAAFLLKNKISYPILIQGSLPKHELIEQFKTLGNAVLLGTNSFWYGVDVRGDTLSCVIIDKLPFAAPGDPVLEARIKMLRKQGIDPFSDYQLPQAVITLKQGVGRLIRDPQDRGVLMICDPRLVGNRYGEVFLNSLPCMNRTRELNKVKNFFTSDAICIM